MHLIPFDPRFNLRLHCLLSLKDCSINISLLLVELARNREGHSLIGDVSVPSSSHVQQNHLVGLNNLIILDIMESSTVLATWADGVESKLERSSFDRMLELEHRMKLILKQARLRRTSCSYNCFRSSLADISDQFDFFWTLDHSQIWNQRP